MSIITHETVGGKNIDLQSVRFFHTHGFNLTPLQPGTKKALEKWKQYQNTRQTWDDLRWMNWSGGIAGINGVAGIRSFDFDQAHKYNPVQKLFQSLGLPVSYQWVVRSGSGYHVWLRCEEAVVLNDTPKSKYVGASTNPQDYPFKQLELRLYDCYTVLPPSMHPNGKRYEWVRGLPESEIAVVSPDVVEYAFYCLAALQTELVDAHKAMVQVSSKYGDRALRDELGKLQNATNGNRNNQLNRSAYALGQLVEGGVLDGEVVEGELTRMGEEIGLETVEVGDTVKSGLTAGKKQPRTPKSREVEEERLLEFSADDEGNAQAGLMLYGDSLLYVKGYGWMIWTGTHWKADEAGASRLIMDTFKQRHMAAWQAKKHDVGNVTMCNAARIEACKKVLSFLIEANIETFDSDPDLLNVANGVLHLPTGTLSPHSSEQRFTYCLTTPYNPHADFSQWEQFIQESVKGGNEVASYIQESVGYSLTGSTKEECLFYVFGPTRAGKGTFTETIAALLGSPLSDEVPFKTFTAKREGGSPNYDLASLKPARFLVAAESSRHEKFNGAVLKQIVGGGRISCEFKYQDRFSYKAMFKIWLTTNWPVNGDADDDGLWSKFRVIEFPHSHLDQEDVDLKRKFQTQLEGVLNWAVQGAMRWYARGRFVTPQIMRDTKEAHREQVDSVGLWLAECCEIGEGEWTVNAKVRTSYVNWCTENGYEPKQAKAFNDSLRRKGCIPNVQKRNGTMNAKGVDKLALLDKL